MPNPDVVSWTSLLNLYLNNRHPIKALSLFSDLIVSTCLRPDPHSIVSSLSACSCLQNLNAGKAIHAIAFRFLSEPEMMVSNALIDMYSRVEKIHMAKCVFDSMRSRDVSTWTSLLNGFVLCGDIESARQIFNEMPRRNVVSWTAMIVGHIRYKDPITALELFKRMRVEGHDSPTSVTIVGVLSGCADIGALDFGRSTHGYVCKVTDLAVNVALNNGLIDMYAKSGNLESALALFIRMGNKDLFSWTSIISGLAFHGRGKHALELFNEMVSSGMTPNRITYLSVLSACSHSGLVHEGQILFERLMTSQNVTIEHYGCMVDLFGRAGLLEEAVGLINCMPMKPDSVIWRSLLSACIGHGNLYLAEIAGNNILEHEPDDDGVYVLLWNLYRSKNLWEDASRLGKMMRIQKIKKQPGCSWLEVNGAVHEFLSEASMLHVIDDVYIVLEGIARQSKSDDLDGFE